MVASGWDELTKKEHKESFWNDGNSFYFYKVLVSCMCTFIKDWIVHLTTMHLICKLHIK